MHIYGGQEVPHSVICKLVWRPKKAYSSVSQSKGLRTKGEPCVCPTAPRLKKQELTYPGVGDGQCSSRRERFLPLPFVFVLDDAYPHLKGQISLLSLLNQMLNSSRNSFPAHLDINITPHQLSRHHEPNQFDTEK